LIKEKAILDKTELGHYSFTEKPEMDYIWSFYPYGKSLS